MDTTPCFICGNLCRTWKDNTFISCCQPCSIAVHMVENGRPPHSLTDRADPMQGDQFPICEQWEVPINKVKVARQGKTTHIKATPKYTHECPCGLLASQCDYHNGL